MEILNPPFRKTKLKALWLGSRLDHNFEVLGIHRFIRKKDGIF
jgi:hypothetical protein